MNVVKGYERLHGAAKAGQNGHARLEHGRVGFRRLQSSWYIVVVFSRSLSLRTRS